MQWIKSTRRGDPHAQKVVWERWAHFTIDGHNLGDTEEGEGPPVDFYAARGGQLDVIQETLGNSFLRGELIL